MNRWKKVKWTKKDDLFFKFILYDFFDEFNVLYLNLYHSNLQDHILILSFKFPPFGNNSMINLYESFLWTTILGPYKLIIAAFTAFSIITERYRWRSCTNWSPIILWRLPIPIKIILYLDRISCDHKGKQNY